MSYLGKHHWSRTSDHARVESDAIVAQEADETQEGDGE